jgi:CheY-like chemotaxis protein
LNQGGEQSALQRFAAGVVHELNNLLTGILGLGERAARQPPEDPELRDHLVHVTAQAERLKRLAERLAEYSRSGLLPAEAPARAPARALREAVAEDTADGAAATILLVEDETVVREIVAAQLEAMGHRVLAFESAEAFEQGGAAARAADVAIIDVYLPGRGGTAFAADLRRANPRIGIVLLSGSPPPAGHSGDLWLTKPVPMQDLGQAVARVRHRPG